MTRRVFNQELQRLLDELLALGSQVGLALDHAVESLVRRDFEKSRQVIADDWHINARYYDIEQGCVNLIATQAPRAADLRMLTSMISISAELERIADYGKGIAKVNLLIGDEPLMKRLVDIPIMARNVQWMLHRSLVAFSHRDIVLAREVPGDDDTVDELYHQVYRELITYMLQNPHYINQANHLLWVAHNLERAADRCTNICQRVVYMVTGQIVNLDQSTVAIDSPVAFEAVEPIQTMRPAEPPLPQRKRGL